MNKKKMFDEINFDMEFREMWNDLKEFHLNNYFPQSDEEWKRFQSDFTNLGAKYENAKCSKLLNAILVEVALEAENSRCIGGEAA